MIMELFDTIQVGDPRGPLLLGPMREELIRELGEAVKACDQVPEYFLDADRAKAMFRALCEDGDESCARQELRKCFDMGAGFARHFDKLNDHLNTLAWAWWRLHRAESRAYGKDRP
jgi:hypothetical protein